MAMVPTRRRRALSGLGTYGPDALAQAAQAILDSLPAGSGVNPIGSAAYPWPHDPAQDNVVDTVYGGNRYVDWYWAHPVRDVSGLIEWTGPDTAQLVGGLDAAHSLAAQVLLQHGDTSWSADFNPPNAIQAVKPLDTTTVTTAPVEYTPTTYAPTADYQVPPPDLLQNPMQTAPAAPTTATPTAPTSGTTSGTTTTTPALDFAQVNGGSSIAPPVVAALVMPMTPRTFTPSPSYGGGGGSGGGGSSAPPAVVSGGGIDKTTLLLIGGGLAALLLLERRR